MVLVILGCPRSGTSLLTRLLVNAGFDISREDLMKPNIHFNKDGYFENINIVKINDQLIRLLNKNNEYTFLNIPSGKSQENFTLLSNENYALVDTENKVFTAMNDIKSRLGQNSIVKDSRFVFTLDSWNFDEVRIIKIKRNRNDVKKSMQKHYGKTFSDEYYDIYDSLIDAYVKKYGGIEVTYEQLLQYDFSKIEDYLQVKLNNALIKQKCNWCSFDTKLVYDVPNSRVGAKIMHCCKCGLVQSHYTNIENKHRYKSISCDSDWGNIRHGKGVRLEQSIDVLKNLEITNILDIGSNRGDFCKWASTHYSNVCIDMIEPDESITNYNFQYNSLYKGRFEHFFKNKQYDLIYCCHTLEHIDNLREFLDKVYTFSTKYVYIDVPNITNVHDENNIEEFFIDKHVFHFSESVLINILESSGFKINVNKTDKFNIVLLCEKQTNLFSLEEYVSTLKMNREKLVEKSSKLNELFTKKKVVLYGATRIFDAMIKYGQLNYKNAYYIVDDFSPLENVYKCDKIATDPPDVIVILARSSIEKIKNKIKNIEIITFQEL